jgi:2,3-dihydroxybiphenyl 1,2-dioxygenase
MPVDRLAYLGVETARIAEWQDFATTILGLAAPVGADGTLHLRLDGKPFRLVLTPGTEEKLGCVGWEIDDAAQLLSLVEELSARGLDVAAGSAADCADRGVDRLFRCIDPDGNTVELCHGHRDLAEAPAFSRPIGGFKTGECGLGHVVFGTTDILPMSDFYEAVLGFRLSDYTAEPFPARFLHVNPRHHSLAFIRTPQPRLHHVMIELYALDDVGQAYDRAQLRDEVIAVTLGRHTNDFMTSFYVATPSGFMVEYGWGGRMIDPDSWQPIATTEGPSLWGHERRWLPEAQRAIAREMRLRAAEAGLKAAVQVTDGFFDVVGG